ncbi:MAG TPA: tyrosine-type recombinase/integrase [Planctomycetota bacterium]|nr:tyrosine-type recombinase/integrase [Planctomycetota bacterium]
MATSRPALPNWTATSVIVDGDEFVFRRAVGKGHVMRVPRRCVLTQSLVDKLPRLAPSVMRAVIWDAAQTGLGVRLGQNGVTYVLQTRRPSAQGRGAPVQRAIDRGTSPTLEEARTTAREWLRELRQGRDPKEAQAVEVTRESLPPLRSYLTAFIDQRRERPLKCAAERLVVLDPPEGSEFAGADVRRRLIARRPHEVTEARVRAAYLTIREDNRSSAGKWLRYLSSLLAFVELDASRQGIPVLWPRNPCRAIGRDEKYRPPARQGHIAERRLPSWFAGIEQVRRRGRVPSVTLDYIELLTTTGLRKQEGARLRWSNVDLEAAVLHLDDTKGGRPFDLPLEPLHLAILNRRRAAAAVGCEWVFPSPKRASQPLSDVREALKSIEECSGVHVTPHDLRRTYASLAATRVTHAELVRLLNHANVGVTMGYVILGAESLRPAMAKVAAAFEAAQQQAKKELRDGAAAADGVADAEGGSEAARAGA